MIASDQAPPVEALRSSGLRILLSDENGDSRFEMRRTAERAGLEVVGEAGYGTEAVSLAVESSPDVVLLSVEEPAARAHDTAEALANALPETPVIVYSTRHDTEAVRRAMLVGARDYLLKPVDAARLAEAVQGALSGEERRQMRRSGQLADVSGRGTVITVASAKGGVGKSVISVNLAIALRRETQRTVAVIDADTNFGDVATLLDLHPSMTVADVVRQRSELSRQNLRDYVTEHRSGVQVVAASEAEGAWDACSVEDIEAIIDAFARVFDYVVIDTSGALDRFVRTCIEASTLSLIVSSGDVSSVRDTVTGAHRLESWGIPADRVRYVMNAAGGPRGVPANDLAQALDRELFWALPHDRAIQESVQVGIPVLERGGVKSATSFLGLARRIAGSEDATTSNGRQPFWRRLMPTRGDSGDTALASARDRIVQR